MQLLTALIEIHIIKPQCQCFDSCQLLYIVHMSNQMRDIAFFRTLMDKRRCTVHTDDSTPLCDSDNLIVPKIPGMITQRSRIGMRGDNAC